MTLGDRASRLQPRPWRANYLLRRALTAQLRAAVTDRLRHRTGLRILDVGCGRKPYLPLLAPYAAEYVGVDHRPGPEIDIVAPAESLPFGDRSFDAVLCIQVLEHVQDPGAVLREMWRVLRPGGVAFVSTHGVANYHPNPDDYWRWTHTGLARLFRMTGTWTSVGVLPNGGTASALGYLIGRQAEVLASKAGAGWALAPFVFALNVVTWNVDRLYQRRYPLRPPDLSSNYLAVAVRADTDAVLRQAARSESGSSARVGAGSEPGEQRRGCRQQALGEP